MSYDELTDTDHYADFIGHPEDDVSIFEDDQFDLEDLSLEDPDVKFIEVGIDSEFTDTMYLSLQVCVRVKTRQDSFNFSFIIFDKEFEDHIKNNLDFSNYKYEFYFENLQNRDFSPLLYYLSKNLYERRIIAFKVIRLYIYIFIFL
jgi:hypothetical protein